MAREEKIRLGGMALPNGVLVHGPTAWACAVRLPDGRLKVVAERKNLRAANVRMPILRGAAKIFEAIALLPRVRRAVPEARLPFERPTVAASMIASAVFVRVVRDSKRLGPTARELVSGLLSVAPAALALRGATSPPTTAPSTSRSGPTSTASRARRSTSVAAPISSARSSPRPRWATRSHRRRPPTCAAPPGWPRPSELSALLRRSSPGWCAIPTTVSRRRSPAPATSCSTASRLPSRHPSSSKWRTPPSRRVSTWKAAARVRERIDRSFQTEPRPSRDS